MSDYVELGKRISRSALKDAWQHERARAEAAEAQVERLTRECLDREATETDARERLRRAEERLAAVEALHVRTPTDVGPDYCPECSEAAQEWVKWPCPTAATIKSDP